MVLAVNVRETTQKVKAYKEKHRLSFQHILDADGNVGASLGVPGTPTTLLFNRAGEAVGGAIGYRDWGTPKAHELLESLLKAEP